MWWTVVGTFGDWWKPWGEASLLLTEPSTSVTLSCLCAAREMPLFAKSDHVVTLIAGTARCGVMWRVSRICCHFL